MNIYGVLDRNDCHIDVSTSLKGTKRYATRNGYTKVSIRYNAGYIADILFEKVNGKWVEYNPPLLEDELDLFADYENLPGEVQAILDKHCTGDQTYEDCAALVRDLEAVGYTCDYGLDAEPHSLKKIVPTEIEWTCTDPDNEQYGRQLSERVFEFKEKNRWHDLDPDNSEGEVIQMTVNLDDYSKDSMYDLVCSYYGYTDFEEFLKTPEGLWIIAECIFEQESSQY